MFFLSSPRFAGRGRTETENVAPLPTVTVTE